MNKAQGSDQIAEGATALFRAPEGSEGQTVTIQVRIRDERPNGGVNSDFFVSPDQPVIIELEYELNRGNLRIDSNNDGLLDGPGTSVSQDDTIELCESKILTLNDNDSDGDTIVDREDPLVSQGDPDLAPMWLIVEAPSAASDPSASLTIDVDDPAIARVYTAESKQGGPIDGLSVPWNTWESIAPGGSLLLFVEGREVGETHITIRVTNSAGVVSEDRLKVAVPPIRFIAGDNSPIPFYGPDGCLLVSKHQTDLDLPAAGQSLFGDVVSDIDTFRIELLGYTASQTPAILLESEIDDYSHLVSMVKDANSSRYRSDTFFRLVSNGAPDNKPQGSQYDDEYVAEQAILVKLGVELRATLLLDGQEQAATSSLSVARPSVEDGPSAVRLARVSICNLTPTPMTQEFLESLTRQLSEDWAQAAIRFDSASQTEAASIAQNAFQVFDEPTQAGTFSFSVTLETRRQRTRDRCGLLCGDRNSRGDGGDSR